MRQRRLQEFTLPFFLLVLLISCRDREETTCNQYFISGETDVNGGTTKIYYNSNQLISALVYGPAYLRVDFSYDKDKKLKEVHDGNGISMRFHFDAKELKSISRTIKYGNGGTTRDSLVMEYDGSGRIIKRTYYNVLASYSILVSYFSVTYPDNKTVVADFYNADGLGGFYFSSKFNYTMDDQPRPYPEEYYYLYLGWGNVVLPHNVLTLETINTSGTSTGTSTFTYKFNAAKYPIEQKGIGGFLTKYQYSCQPQVE